MNTLPNNITQDQIAEITLRWARHSAPQYPRWEINELHNEAFVIAMYLVQEGRYDPDKGALSTFLWNSVPLDIRHRYKRMHGERRLTRDGKREYIKVEICDTAICENTEASWDGNLQTLDPKSSTVSKWTSLRLAGYKPKELCKLGFSYKEQEKAAEEFRNEQQRQRGEG